MYKPVSLLKSWWKNYKFRSIPWLILQFRKSQNSGRKSVGTISTSDNSSATPISQLTDSEKIQRQSLNIAFVTNKQDVVVSSDHIYQQLLKLFTAFESEVNATASVYDEILYKTLGFTIEIAPSSLNADAGRGVFVSRGTVKAGSVVALYPGTVYQPWEPLLFASIRNQYILRCKNGLLIDGKSQGLSKQVFKSCSARDRFGLAIPCCDLSWMEQEPRYRMNTGQIVNNSTWDRRNNVVYQEFLVGLPGISEPDSFAFHPDLWKYLPNVWYGAVNNVHGLPIAPLVATKDIAKGEEILSSYHTIITK